MAVGIFIAAIILGSITFGIVNKHTIATRDHMLRSWVWCAGIWFAILALLFNLVLYETIH